MRKILYWPRSVSAEIARYSPAPSGRDGAARHPGYRVPVRTIASRIEMGETHEVLRKDYPH